MRLIDADALKNHYSWWEGGTKENTLDEQKEIFDTIVNLQPTIDPVKHGKWIVKEKAYPDLPNDSDYRYECSLCGWGGQHNEKMIVPYCWHCGARMDGE